MTPDGGFGVWSDSDGNLVWVSADNEVQGNWAYDTDSDLSGTWWSDDDEGTWTAASSDPLMRTAVSMYDRGIWYGLDNSEGKWRGIKGEMWGQWQNSEGTNTGTWEYDLGSTETGMWMSDNSEQKGTFHSDANSIYIRYATPDMSLTEGEWLGVDGSIGTWSSSDVNGNTWVSQDG